MWIVDPEFISIFCVLDHPSILFFHLNRDASKSPSYWSRICLYNMARLAKEATTVRRVLEPFFHSFDSENYWSSEKGLARSVLTYMQLLLEESGYTWNHFTLRSMVKDLDIDTDKWHGNSKGTWTQWEYKVYRLIVS